MSLTALPLAAGEKVLVALRVASAGGICGLLTVGYLSFLDAGGYDRYGFRPPGVPCLWASSWGCMPQPRSAPIRLACSGCLGRTTLWGIQWGQ